MALGARGIDGSFPRAGGRETPQWPRSVLLGKVNPCWGEWGGGHGRPGARHPHLNMSRSALVSSGARARLACGTHRPLFPQTHGPRALNSPCILGHVKLALFSFIILPRKHHFSSLSSSIQDKCHLLVNSASVQPRPPPASSVQPVMQQLRLRTRKAPHSLASGTVARKSKFYSTLIHSVQASIHMDIRSPPGSGRYSAALQKPTHFSSCSVFRDGSSLL